jgi:hypothetical protein
MDRDQNIRVLAFEEAIVALHKVKSLSPEIAPKLRSIIHWLNALVAPPELTSFYGPVKGDR